MCRSCRSRQELSDIQVELSEHVLYRLRSFIHIFFFSVSDVLRDIQGEFSEYVLYMLRSFIHSFFFQSLTYFFIHAPFFTREASMKSEKREKEGRKSKNENTRLRR